MGSGSKGKSDRGSNLADIANAFYLETTPLRRNLISQMDEALTTGGIGARIPLIAKSQEASKRATSSALQQTDEDLARSRLAGTPFGAQARSDVLQRGEINTAMIPTNIVAQMLQTIPGFVTGANQTIISGLGQSAGAQASQAGAEAGFLGALLSPFSFAF